jgi:outer membrane receptor protein involved in Fe transport
MLLPRLWMTLRLLFTAAALTLAAASLATAQGSPPDSVRRIEPVSVRGSRAPSVTGGATSLIIRPDSLPIPLQPAAPLAEMLRQTAFVLVRQNSRGEMEIGVRGSDSRQAAVFLDGLPLTAGWDSRTDPSLIPTTGIEQISFVRGLATLLGGANSLGGVLRMDLNAPVSGTARRAAALRLGAGVDEFQSTVLSASGVKPFDVAGGVLRLSGGLTSRQRHGLALAGGDLGNGLTGGVADPGDISDRRLRTNTALEQLDGFAAVRYDHRSGAFAGFTGTAYNAKRGVAPEQHIAAPRFWRYPEQRRSLGVLSVGSGLRKTPFGQGRIDASAGQTTQSLEIESFTDRTYSVLSTRELGGESSTITRIEASHTLPRSAMVKLASTGSTVRYDETLDAQLATAAPVRYEQRLSSVGAELEIPLAGSVLLSGGIVQDEARTPKTGGRTALGTLSRSGWRVGTTWRAADGVRLHASASERARFAALRELYSGSLNRFDPNPDLKPENLRGIEAGVTLDDGAFAKKGLQLQVVGFRHNLEDAVIRITLPNRRFRRINRDEIKSSGVELLASFTPVGWRGASITADATLQKIRVYDQTITTGGNERFAEHNPEQRANLALASPTILGVRGSVMARHTGAQYCQHPDLARLVKLDAQTTGDAAVTRSFSLRRDGLLKKLTALLAMDNVANRTVYDQCGLPQPGRTLRVGVTLQ